MMSADMLRLMFAAVRAGNPHGDIRDISEGCSWRSEAGTKDLQRQVAARREGMGTDGGTVGLAILTFRLRI